jgi:hypothetical protein
MIEKRTARVVIHAIRETSQVKYIDNLFDYLSQGVNQEYGACGASFHIDEKRPWPWCCQL